MHEQSIHINYKLMYMHDSSPAQNTNFQLLEDMSP